MSHAFHLSTPLIVAALALDLAAGDPRWLPHPVALIGRGISFCERYLRTGAPGRDLVRGALAAAVVAASAAGLTWALIAACDAAGPALGAAMGVLVAWTTLAMRGLDEAALAVETALRAGDEAAARRAIPALVGRDPDSLDRAGLIRATVESLAENLSDGVIAPLFFLFAAGPAGAMAYKAINTLDSMVGHRTERHLHFGRAAARLDDAANFIPARLSALCIVGSSAILNRRGAAALGACLADARGHSSPNAGHPEAAMAGALGIELGGDAVYGGELERHAVLGRAEHPPRLRHIGEARRIAGVAAALALLSLALARSLAAKA